jgi:UDP:flavonoid glycosyltransferase YjiC (YdhE family)
MSKRIAIATIGTMGDVLPYISLAKALKKHGYDVVLGAPIDFEGLIKKHGIEFHNLGQSIRSFVTQTSFDDTFSKNHIINMPNLLAQGLKIIDAGALKTWDMVQSADAIIVNINTCFGIDMAEALNIPVIMSGLQPIHSTKEFPLYLYSGPNFGTLFNRLSYAAASVQQAYFDLPRFKIRNKLGLNPIHNGGFAKDAQGNDLTTLYAYSELISPKPKDWSKKSFVTGFWRVPDIDDWKPSIEFLAFLNAGEKPIYIGFGSMPFGAKQNTKILIDAAKKWGGRVVIATGWGGLKSDGLPPEIFAIKNAPHDKLFKYMAAVVHHGGAGTTAAGLYAGCPTFVLPQAVDQPFWGQCVHELKCGPKPIALQKLTSDILAKGLSDIYNNPIYKKNASALSKKLEKEIGAKNAVKKIEGVMRNYKNLSRKKHV